MSISRDIEATAQSSKCRDGIVTFSLHKLGAEF